MSKIVRNKQPTKFEMRGSGKKTGPGCSGADGEGLVVRFPVRGGG